MPRLALVSSAAVAAVVLLAGCRDVQSFSTTNDHFEGAVVQADFVRSGIDASTRLCLTLDTNHLQDGPGSIWTSDGQFQAAPLRPIPQIWHDPLSTLSFGEGRTKNVIYVASPTLDGGASVDVVTVVSLMDSGGVEVRLLQGAPAVSLVDASTATGPPNLFAVFALSRQSGACPF